MSVMPGHARFNPYPGLRPFREDEEHLFFGRENQVDAMVNKLAATRFLAVVGTSGSGKSSLVNCGLRPALRQGLMTRAGTAWRMAQFRPGSNPIREMAGALAQDGVLFREHKDAGLPLAEIIETTLRMSKLGLIDIIEQAALDEGVNVLVVADQFEELFRYRQPSASGRGHLEAISEEATAFVNLLLEIKQRPDCPIYVVLTMRSDFLGDCTHFPGLAEAINAGQYLVPRMTRDERRDAIARPAGVGGAAISPVLLTRLVNDVGDNPDQLSILQHALNRTWTRWEKDGASGPLDLVHYEAIGGMSRALDRHAEEAHAELATPRQQRVCEDIFKALTDKATDLRGIRRPTALATLCALADAGEAEVTAVIDVFRDPSRSFLMPPAGQALDAHTIIDISHESLMRVWQRLDTWAEEESRSARMYRRVAETAALHAAGQASLWRDPDLQRALDWREHSRPNETWAARYGGGFDVAMTFLRDSEAARDAALEQERKRVAAEAQARERELAQAKALEAAHRQRAEEQAAAARRQRNYSYLLVVLLLMAAGLAYYGWHQRGQAQEEGRLALSRELAALANHELAMGEKRRALQFAAAGYRVVPTKEARQSLHRALAIQPQLRTFLSGHKSEVWGVAFSPDGRTIASASTDESVILWDVATRQPRGEPLTGHRAEVWDVAFSPDGKTLASGSSDNTVILWDVASRKPLGAPLKGHHNRVWSVTFSPDGKTLASASWDHTVMLWDVASRKPIGEPLSGHQHRVSAVAFSPDGKTLATTSWDKTVMLWDVASRKPIGEPLQGHQSDAWGVAFSPDGATLASTSSDNTVILWDVASREKLASLLGHKDRVYRVVFSADGRTLASSSADGTVILWDAASRQALGEPFKGHQARVPGVAFSPDGRSLVSASEDWTVILWDAASRERARESLSGHDSTVFSVAFSADGSTLASGSWDKSIMLWDVKARKPLGNPLKGHQDRVWGVTFSPDGKMLASTSSDSSIILWDVATRIPLREALKGHADRVWSVAFSPDGKTLASASADKTVMLWDIASGKRVGQPLNGHLDRVLSVAFSPDGTTLASASADQTLMLWDVASRKPLGEALKGHESAVWGVTFSPNGKLLASASGDKTIMLWDTSNRKPAGEPLRGHRREVWGVAFSPDGKTLASASWDKTVILWDVASRQPRGDPLEGHQDRVWGVTFSADGKTLATGSSDRSAILWDVVRNSEDIETTLRTACSVANRNLARFEWEAAVGMGTPYQASCLDLPVPSSASVSHRYTLK